jgi:hypothetical protein
MRGARNKVFSNCDDIIGSVRFFGKMIEQEKQPVTSEEFIKSLGIKFYSPEGRIGVVDAIKFGKSLKSDMDKEKAEEDMERLLKFSNKNEEYKETFRKTARFFEGNFEMVTVLEKTLEEMLPKDKMDPLIEERINLRDILRGYTVGSLLKNIMEVRAEKQFEELTEGMSPATLSEVCGDLIRVESGYQSRVNLPKVSDKLNDWMGGGVFGIGARHRVEYITEVAQDVK